MHTVYSMNTNYDISLAWPKDCHISHYMFLQNPKDSVPQSVITS